MARVRHRYPPRVSPEIGPSDRNRRQSATPRVYAGGIGLGVDAQGGPVIDPTANVLLLVEAAEKRQDDLREMNNLRIDAELRNQEQLADLREKHQIAIDSLEAKRLDAVRNVDQLAAKTEADRTSAALTALTTTANTTAETLRSAGQVSAQNLATQFQQAVAAITERIAALEKSSYTGQGKQAVADPMMTELVGEMRNLTAQRAADMGKAAIADPRLLELMAEVKANSRLLSVGTGKTEGMSDATKILVGFIGLIATLVAISGALSRTPAPPPLPQPQVIYVPAPAGSMLPTTPPQAAPR